MRRLSIVTTAKYYGVHIHLGTNLVTMEFTLSLLQQAYQSLRPYSKTLIFHYLNKLWAPDMRSLSWAIRRPSEGPRPASWHHTPEKSSRETFIQLRRHEHLYNPSGTA